MKLLTNVKPTPEQLKLFVPDPQTMIIKGAAGSGKTTTCLLRLRIVIQRLAGLKARTGDDTPLRVLVFSYNRTLCAYISQLAESQKQYFSGAHVQISTFAKWAYSVLGVQRGQICEEWKGKYLSAGFANFPQSDTFLENELEYVLGRFPHDSLTDYLENERTGRGLAPRFDGKRKEQFLHEVIYPYLETKKAHNELDFIDLAYNISKLPSPPTYDVVIIDEGQDFSANELRAIVNVLKEDHSFTMVIDSAQKIYSKSFLWREVGIKVGAENVFTLTQNFRNTKEIAQFIAPIIQGADLGGDFGALPSPDTCLRHGQKPDILEGKYSDQLSWVIENKIKTIDLTKESIAFLHPKGWFNEIKKELRALGLPFVNLTKEEDWPEDNINIGFVTMHSSKGLEFDHVVIIGLNQEMTPHGTDAGDVFLDHYKRLLAMSCGRARETLTIGYKKEEMSTLVSYFDSATYIKHEV